MPPLECMAGLLAFAFGGSSTIILVVDEPAGKIWMAVTARSAMTSDRLLQGHPILPTSG